MQLRRIEWSTLALALVSGAALPVGSLSGDTGRLLVTFLGLISASILPTVSLIIGGMTASGRSVKAINELQAELSAAIDALFFLFGLVGVSLIGLVYLTIPVTTALPSLPYLASGLGRAGQAIVAMAASLIVLRAGQIPAILRRSLNVRYRIATDEARRTTLENAPGASSIKEAFPTHPEFGRTIDLGEIQARDPH